MTFTTSATKIKDYMMCRLYYYDRHILKGPQVKDTSAVMGTAIHKAIEDGYRGINPVFTYRKTINTELDSAVERGDTINYRLSYNDMLDTGEQILAGYDFTRFHIGESERRFAIPLQFVDATITGSIDRITNDGIILDYKSAKQPPKDLNNDPQFTIYTWAYINLFGDWPKHVYWYHLRTHRLYEYDTSHVGEKMNLITDTIQRMMADTFESTDRCARCVPWCKHYV